MAGIDSDHDATPSPAAPSFSPVSDWEGTSESAGSSSSSESSDTEPTTVEDPSLGESEPALSAEPAGGHGPSIAHQLSTPHSPEPATAEWCGFKIVGDNVDKNVRPSLQRLTHQTQSLHHFHSYAVKDRVNFGAASDVSKSQPVDSSSFVMTKQDWEQFQKHCCVIISRYSLLYLEGWGNHFGSLFEPMPSVPV